MCFVVFIIDGLFCFVLFCYSSVTATSCGTKNTDNYYNGDDDQKMIMRTIKLLLAVFFVRDVNVVSDVKAVSTRLLTSSIKTKNNKDAFNVCLL